MLRRNLDEILDRIGDLTPEELRIVQDALHRLLDVSQNEEAFLRRAAEYGLRITLPEEPMSVEEYDRFQPMRLFRGRSVSETLIEERR